MVRSLCGVLLFFALTVGPRAGLAGTPTAHLLPMQGYATDSQGVALPSADLRVLILDAPSGGITLYDSGTDFAGSVSSGFFDVVLGAVTPLALDNTQLHFMKIFLDGVEVVGENSGGRWAFYPGTGSHQRSDLEARLDALEMLVGFSKNGGAQVETPLVPANFRANGTTAQVEYGLLGVGLVTGTTGTTQVLGNLLLQPVGVFASGDRVLRLGPWHMPPPEQITAVADLVPPLQTRLLGCYPNPFNPRTSIRFELKESCAVRIGVYDTAGRLVRTLVADERFPAGAHEVVWNGRDDRRRSVASGTYFYRFHAGDVVATRSMTLLK